MVDVSPQSQPYDLSLKGISGGNVEQFISTIVPGMVFERELNVELVRPVIRCDKVYLVMFRKQWHVLHTEFQASYDELMGPRVYAYNGLLYLEYEGKYPVLSIVVYPFNVGLPTSPLIIYSGDEKILDLKYRIIPLYERDARHYLKKRVVAMYALLPTMKYATEELLTRAIAEMALAYQQDQAKMREQLIWMGILTQRSSTLTDVVKANVRRRIDMFQQLWDEDPWVQKLKAEAQAKGEVEGRAKGKAEGALKRAHWDILRIIQKRFPAILQRAQEQIEQNSDLDQLGELFDQLLMAPDEATALLVLNQPAGSHAPQAASEQQSPE